MVAFSNNKNPGNEKQIGQVFANKVRISFPKDEGLLTYVGFSVYYLAIPVTVLSWVFEVLAGTSMWALALPLVSCPVILRANVVLEVIKAVGLSTAFIMLVHNSLDKQVLGLRYSDIIQHHFAYYWLCSVIHVAFTLGGIASGVAGASESALASLYIVLFGLRIQWKVVHKIIVNKSEREYLADQLWKHKIEDQASSQEIRAVAHQLASEIGKVDGHASSILMNRFAHAFVMFASKGKLNIRVAQISDIWAIVLQGHTEANLGTLVGEILAACINCSDVPFSVRKSALITICGGYVVHQFQKEISTVNNEEEKLSKIASSIAGLLYRIPVESSSQSQDLTKDVYHYMCTIFTAMAMITFFRNKTKMNNEILRLQILADKKECKTCIWETARAIFPVVEATSERELEDHIERAYNFTIKSTV